jgi:hypothetical protein
MTRIGGVVVAAAVAACGGSRGSAPQARPATTVWDLAPEGTFLAISTRNGDWWELLERAEVALAEAPGGERPRSFISSLLSYPRVAMRSEAARRATGVDDDALIVNYFTDRGHFSVYRVADRAAYDRTYGVKPDRASRGRMTVDVDGSICAVIEGLQACGPRELLAEVLDGKRASIAWPAGAPPTVRIWVAARVLGPAAAFTESGDGLRIEVDVGDGQLVARAHLSGAPAGEFARLAAGARSPLAAALPERGVSGASVVNLIEQVDAVRPQLLGTRPDVSIGSLTWDDLVEALRGDASMWIASDNQTGAIAFGLRRTDAVRRWVARCEDLQLTGVTAARVGDRCRLRSQTLEEARLGDLMVSVSDDALIAEVVPPAGTPPSPAAVAGSPSPVVAHMREGRDLVATFGAGIMASAIATAATFPTFEGEDRFYVWLFLHFTESSAWLRVDRDGLRAELRLATTWRYDRDTIAAVEPILRRMVTGEPAAGVELEQLAAARRGGALAVDLARGKVGPAFPVMTGVLVVKLISAVAGSN